MEIALLGSGSWATAIAKILVDNKHTIHWWFRQKDSINFFKKHNYNQYYLTHVKFNLAKIRFFSDLKDCLKKPKVVIICIPASYIENSVQSLKKEDWEDKKIVSAVKGILPYKNYLLNEFLAEKFNTKFTNYFTLLGPSHAEEVVLNKTTYLTVSGLDIASTKIIAKLFNNDYIKTRFNNNIKEVQYAAILKNIYAIGTGLADGLGYGDNFISTFIANCGREMDAWLIYLQHIGSQDYHPLHSVIMGDLLVTCYSLFSRNRHFGKMIGKGSTPQITQSDLKMVAEGYNACNCLYNKYQKDFSLFPITHIIYKILWQNANPQQSFKKIEKLLI